MSRGASRDLEQGVADAHRDAAAELVFGERNAQLPAAVSTTAAADSTATRGGNLKEGDAYRGTGNVHVTFGNFDETEGTPTRKCTASNLLSQASIGSFSLNSNGSFHRSVSGLERANTCSGNIPASTPLQLLYQSFANPISDEQAIENGVRETLRQKPMWRWKPTEGVTVPPVVVHDGDDEAQAMAALSSGDELRECVDPTAYYIFRNCVRAPREERPRPYLFTEITDSLSLATATQDAARPRHSVLHTSEPAARKPGATSAHEPVDTAQPRAQKDEPTSSSLQIRQLTAHEPAVEEEGNSDSGVTQKLPGSNPSTSPLAAEEMVPLDVANKINRTFLITGAFHAEPVSEADIRKEMLIVDTFNALPSEQRRREILEAFYVAHLQPYEHNASYTADDWDDMTETKVPRWFGVEFDTRRWCFFVTAFKRRVRVFLFSFLLRAFCLFLFWIIMFCLLPRNWFYPGGLYFDTISTIVFSGIVGTLAARVLTIPSIVGVMWAGILWNSIPYTARLTAGITMDMRQFISMFGLTIGLIRAGLSLSVIRFKQKFKHYITFSLLPMSMEMVVHGVCCKYIYNYPNYRWAFAEGFLLSSIAPSVVVPVILSFQRRGYGVRDGPSMMMLCSIAVDTAACVWGTEFLLSLEFHRMSTALSIILAPLQILVGIVGGIILGALVFVVTFYILFMEGERLPSVRNDRVLTLRHSVHVRYISICFMVLVSFTAVAIGKRFSVLGGSAIGVVTIAGTFNYLCVRGGTADHLRVKADMAQTLTTVWDYAAMPALFGLSGAAVDVHELFSRSFIGRAFALVLIGIGTRSLFAMLSPIITRLRLSWPEILFCGLGWIGKGSVQGSLGPLAQTYATAELAAAATPEARALAQARIDYGRKMKNTAVLGILVACPLCSIFLTRFTGRLLKPNT
ncbi:hypothetical protein ABL78_2576 [Leptomonas seymouri]|uniref:Uncharacterized protein n=1 Tax=Leptomonas seymouri TaxID=5684 RepID=A0A0N0P7H5_LEPSE|nr:hypothetical protein ABL78_2576 [Leptomonas seymouri]|eukprot:KPI88337.1 hypothetical protein ABL78_2576 [Leptomonas seymouri]